MQRVSFFFGGADSAVRRSGFINYNIRSISNGGDMAERTYRDEKYWEKYHDFLPEEFRFREGRLPDEEFWTWKGNKIHLDVMRNRKSEYKFILLHGGGGNGRLLSTFGSALYNNGYEYIAPDLPGFGLTEASEKDRSDYGSWIELVSDLVDQEYEQDDRPVILFGASIGGMVAYHAACKNSRVKGVISTCLCDSRQVIVRDAMARNRLWSRAGGFFMKKFSFITDRIYIRASWISKMSRITNDPVFSRVFIRDPHVGRAKISLRFYRTMTEYKPMAEPEVFSSCPLLLVHPGLDRWTPVDISRKFFDRIAGCKKIFLIEGCGHYPYEGTGPGQMLKAVELFLEKIKDY